MIPLPKKGNTKKCKNNRTISLINHSSKVLLNILLSRMKPTAREIINEAQAGFTKGRGTVEQIGNVRTINEKYIEHQNYVYHNFIDFKKAFDRVWHEALWLTMLKHNFRPSIVPVLKSLYEHAKAQY